MEAATFAKSIIRPRPRRSGPKTAGRVWAEPMHRTRVWIARSWSWTKHRGLRRFSDQPVAEIVQCGEPILSTTCGRGFGGYRSAVPTFVPPPHKRAKQFLISHCRVGASRFRCYPTRRKLPGEPRAELVFS